MTATFRTSQIVSDIEVGKPHLILVGLPGSGKTAVGEALGARLNRSFLDFDREIERRESASISEIFAVRGGAQRREQVDLPLFGKGEESLAVALLVQPIQSVTHERLVLWVGMDDVIDVFGHARGDGSGGIGRRDDEVGKARDCFVFAWGEELRRVGTARGLCMR